MKEKHYFYEQNLKLKISETENFTFKIRDSGVIEDIFPGKTSYGL